MKATDPTPAAPDTHEELGMYLHLTEQTLLHEAERAGLTKPTPIITWWDLTQQERDLKIHAGRALFDYGREEYEQLGAEHAASRALQVAVRILRGRFPGSPSPEDTEFTKGWLEAAQALLDHQGGIFNETYPTAVSPATTTAKDQ